MTTPNGIKDLVGREPIAAALAVGIKGPSGAPTERDRFHILRSHAQTANFGNRTGLVREPHPSFNPFNAAQPGDRQTVKARLAHATIDECWTYKLKAQVTDVSAAVHLADRSVDGPGPEQLAPARNMGKIVVPAVLRTKYNANVTRAIGLIVQFNRLLREAYVGADGQGGSPSPGRIYLITTGHELPAVGIPRR